MSVYEVIAVRYGTRTGAKSEIYLNYPTYGEPDEPLGMDYYFWVARNAERRRYPVGRLQPAGPDLLRLRLWWLWADAAAGKPSISGAHLLITGFLICKAIQLC